MKGLSFSGPLVPKVLDGSKTVTRRLPTFRPMNRPIHPCNVRCLDGVTLEEYGAGGVWLPVKPPYQPGEIVYLKETFIVAYHDGQCEELDPPRVHYRADPASDNLRWLDESGEGFLPNVPWKSPRFMPEWASRQKLEILSVRPERVQEITEEDAVLEGFASVAEFLAYFATLHKGLLPEWVWRIEYRRQA